MARSPSGHPSRPRTRLTRDEIAAAAVRIADTEGFDALSMRRLACELDAGTMTLYHYVRNKDELLAIVNDAVMGELVVPDEELPDDWRDALMTIACRSRDVILDHAWSLEIRDQPTPGPNAARHFDQTMKAVAALDLPLPQLFELVTAVDEYVFGYCFYERANYFDQDASSDVHDEPSNGTNDVASYMAELVATGDYPALAVLAEQYGVDGTIEAITGVGRDRTRFERNLRRLLDGFAADYGLP